MRNGEDTLTLQVYCPASDTRSGLSEKTRELPVPDVTLPLGWINVMVVVVDSLSLPVTVAVQVRVWNWPAVKGPVGDEVMEAPTVSVGTAGIKSKHCRGGNLASYEGEKRNFDTNSVSHCYIN